MTEDPCEPVGIEMVPIIELEFPVMVMTVFPDLEEVTLKRQTEEGVEIKEQLPPLGRDETKETCGVPEISLLALIGEGVTDNKLLMKIELMVAFREISGAVPEADPDDLTKGDGFTKGEDDGLELLDEERVEVAVEDVNREENRDDDDDGKVEREALLDAETNLERDKVIEVGNTGEEVGEDVEVNDKVVIFECKVL